MLQSILTNYSTRLVRPAIQNYITFSYYSTLNRRINHQFLTLNSCINCQSFLINNQSNSSQKRHFSILPNNSSLLETQSAIFKVLSESPPVECCQQFLLSIHNVSGLPWWTSIVLSTIILRTAITLPLAIYQQYILAKYENLKQELPALANELKKETAIAVKMFKWDEKTAKIMYNRSMKKQWNNLIVRDNCHPFKSLLLVWFQIPLWVSLSVSLRNFVYMLPNQDINAQLIYTELTVGGFGVIPNLTLPDESLIFPVTLGILNLMIVELQLLARNQSIPRNKAQTIITNFFRGLSVIMIPISASVPSCLALYWTTSSAYGLLQNTLILSPKIRRFCRIPQTVNEVKNPYQLVITNLKGRWKLLEEKLPIGNEKK